jgi:hypothetical protein
LCRSCSSVRRDSSDEVLFVPVVGVGMLSFGAAFVVVDDGNDVISDIILFRWF